MKNDSLSDHQLLQLRTLALNNYRLTMPKKGENPEVHAARCWYDAVLNALFLAGYKVVKDEKLYE